MCGDNKLPSGIKTGEKTGRAIKLTKLEATKTSTAFLMRQLIPWHQGGRKGDSLDSISASPGKIVSDRREGI